MWIQQHVGHAGSVVRRACDLLGSFMRVTCIRATCIRGILSHLPHLKTFVVAIDGAVVEDENFSNLLMDVAALWPLSVRVVLVHGVAAQIQVLARKSATDALDLEGSGVTDTATLRFAHAAASRRTHEIVEGLSVADIPGATSNAFIARPLGILKGFDHRYAGRIRRIDVEFLLRLIGSHIVSVLPRRVREVTVVA